MATALLVTVTAYADDNTDTTPSTNAQTQTVTFEQVGETRAHKLESGGNFGGGRLVVKPIIDINALIARINARMEAASNVTDGMHNKNPDPALNKGSTSTNKNTGKTNNSNKNGTTNTNKDGGNGDSTTDKEETCNQRWCAE